MINLELKWQITNVIEDPDDPEFDLEDFFEKLISDPRTTNMAIAVFTLAPARTQMVLRQNFLLGAVSFITHISNPIGSSDNEVIFDISSFEDDIEPGKLHEVKILFDIVKNLLDNHIFRKNAEVSAKCLLYSLANNTTLGLGTNSYDTMPFMTDFNKKLELLNKALGSESPSYNSIEELTGENNPKSQLNYVLASLMIQRGEDEAMRIAQVYLRKVDPQFLEALDSISTRLRRRCREIPWRSISPLDSSSGDMATIRA